MKIELQCTDSRTGKFSMDQLPVIVGLDPGSDICLNDSAVGHYQCMIDTDDDGLMVWDLGTKLGTYINGVRVQKKAPIMPGDELTFGRNSFVVHYDLAGAQPRRHIHTASKPEARSTHPQQARRREPAIS